MYNHDPQLLDQQEFQNSKAHGFRTSNTRAGNDYRSSSSANFRLFCPFVRSKLNLAGHYFFQAIALHWLIKSWNYLFEHLVRAYFHLCNTTEVRVGGQQSCVCVCVCVFKTEHEGIRGQTRSRVLSTYSNSILLCMRVARTFQHTQVHIYGLLNYQYSEFISCQDICSYH